MALGWFDHPQGTKIKGSMVGRSPLFSPRGVQPPYDP
jgi:hypothetical protein